MRIRAPALLKAKAASSSALPRRVRLLLDASLALSAEQDLDELLRRLIAIACELIDARYGALLIEDIGTLVTFVTHGITAEQHALIGDPPSRTGLHGHLLNEGRTVVIDDLLSDPRTTGYPPNHPVMRSFLGTPVRAGTRVIGELYLADKRKGRRFADADIEIVEGLAAVAGVAYRNARLLYIEQQSAAHAQAMLDLHAKGYLDEMLFWSQVWAREDERARLARDIHDEQGQILTSLILFSKHLEQQLDSEMAPQVSGLRQLAEQALRAARTLAQQLRPLELDQLGLVPALNRLVEHTAQRCGIAVDFIAGQQQARLTYALEVVVYRIAQQALTNVARHSRARSASVTLSGSEDWLTLIIEDDGVGFDCEAVLANTRDVAHTGVRTMRDRARSIGGELVVESDRWSGTLVRLRVPTSGESAHSGNHAPGKAQPGPRCRTPRHYAGLPAAMSTDREPDVSSGKRVTQLKVLLIDDHAVVRAGLRLLIEQQPDLRVCGETASVAGAIALDCEPDIILLDLVLGQRARGQDVVLSVIKHFRGVPVLALSMIDSLAVVDAVLSAGARGYVLKDAAADELVVAIRSVASGKEYLQPSLGAAMIRWKNRPVTIAGPRAVELTRREREILRLVALGYTNAEISQALSLSVRTVETHRSHIVRKTGAHTRAQLVRFAQDAHLIE